MQINVTSENDSCAIALQGDMTIYTAMQCKEEMLAPLQDCQTVAVDLSGVFEMDTSGLQILALFLNETDERNIRVRFSAVSDAVQEFLSFCGLSNILGTAEAGTGVH